LFRLAFKLRSVFIELFTLFYDNWDGKVNSNTEYCSNGNVFINENCRAELLSYKLTLKLEDEFKIGERLEQQLIEFNCCNIIPWVSVICIENPENVLFQGADAPLTLKTYVPTLSCETTGIDRVLDL